MAEWVIGIVEKTGYAGIALLMFLENVFPPIPSELIMPLGGFAATGGELSFAWVCVYGTIGSVVGQLPLYYLGRVLGEERIKAFAERHGKWLLVSGEDVERASAWFDRHGGQAVLFCRVVPGVRSLISIPAGIRKMNLGRFLLYSTLGMGVWATLLAWAGRLLGANYEAVSDYIGPAAIAVFALLIGALVWRAVRRKRRQGRRSREARDESPQRP